VPSSADDDEEGLQRQSESESESPNKKRRLLVREVQHTTKKKFTPTGPGLFRHLSGPTTITRRIPYQNTTECSTSSTSSKKGTIQIQYSQLTTSNAVARGPCAFSLAHMGHCCTNWLICLVIPGQQTKMFALCLQRPVP
jgi:hypothetical protein